MRAIIFVLLVIVEVFGSEKDNAIKAVTTKFEELEGKYKNLKDIIDVESKKTDQELEKQTTNELNNNFQSTGKEIETSAKENAKTAIAKGKPLSAIECLVKVSLEGGDLITETKAGFTKAIEDVPNIKNEKLRFCTMKTELIKIVITELKDQAVKKLSEIDGPFETLKNDIIKKIEVAKKQLGEIEPQITKPNLADEYVSLKAQIQNKFKEIKDALIKKLQKCVA